MEKVKCEPLQCPPIAQLIVAHLDNSFLRHDMFHNRWRGHGALCAKLHMRDDCNKKKKEKEKHQEQTGFRDSLFSGSKTLLGGLSNAMWSASRSHSKNTSYGATPSSLNSRRNSTALVNSAHTSTISELAA
jgi:hypothetical protein